MLITSGKTVHGTGTNFQRDLELGDFIIVTIPSTGE